MSTMNREKEGTLNYLSKRANVEYDKMSRTTSDNELVVMIPVKFTLNEDKTDIIKATDVDLDKYRFDKTVKHEHDYCPFCNKFVTSGTQFITDVDGQKCHLSCYSNADY